MTEDLPEAHVNFDAPAVLRKWPSLHNERRTDSTGQYLVVDDSVEKVLFDGSLN
jgi:hypothetical protein